MFGVGFVTIWPMNLIATMKNDFTEDFRNRGLSMISSLTLKERRMLTKCERMKNTRRFFIFLTFIPYCVVVCAVKFALLYLLASSLLS